MEAPDETPLKRVLLQYFELEDQIAALSRTVEDLKSRQKALVPGIHGLMRAASLDEISVRDRKFVRVIPVARRRPVKDRLLKNVLSKHLSGEDGRLRGVLEDLERLRAVPDPEGPPEEKLMVRKMPVK